MGAGVTFFSELAGEEEFSLKMFSCEHEDELRTMCVCVCVCVW